MDGSVPMFRLTARGGDGLCCDRRGIALGPVALVEAADANGRRVYRLRPAEEIARALALAYDPFTTDDLARRLSGLEVAARALEADDLAKATVATVLMKLPPLSTEAMAKLARDPMLKKYSPDQPRDERGRWTSGESADAGADDGASAPPLRVAANDTGVMSDAGGILPAPASAAAQVPPPPAGDGKVREYSPEEAAKLPPPPAGSKYVTLNDGSVLWSQWSNHGKGGPMLMPADVSLEENAKRGEQIFAEYLAEIEERDISAAEGMRRSTMVHLFHGAGEMDYQLIYSVNGRDANKDYIDIGNYNYGVIAAAAGIPLSEAIVGAGAYNLRGTGEKDWRIEFNNPRNYAMFVKGYHDYQDGRINSGGR